VNGQLIHAAAGVHEAAELERELAVDGGRVDDLRVGEAAAVVVLGHDLPIAIGQPQVRIVTRRQRVERDGIGGTGLQLGGVHGRGAVGAVALDGRGRAAGNDARVTLTEGDGAFVVDVVRTDDFDGRVTGGGVPFQGEIFLDAAAHILSDRHAV